MITLFRCSTLEDWTDVMYINMHGCQYYGYGGGLEHLCYCKVGWVHAEPYSRRAVLEVLCLQANASC